MADPLENRDTPKRRFTDAPEGFTGSVGADVSIEGALRGATSLEIWGRFEGEMEVEGLVWLRPGSTFSGDLRATDVVVEGDLAGTVRAASKIDLRSTSRVEAEITAARVAAAEGSLIEGRITVSGGSEEAKGYTERRERRQ